MESDHIFEFGPYRLDVGERLLLKDGSPVLLTPKAFEILCVLVARAGHLVGKEDLLREVWHDSFVEESSLARNVYLLRKSLGEGADGRPYIQTVPRQGYRFVVEVKAVGVADSAPRTAQSEAAATDAGVATSGPAGEGASVASHRRPRAVLLFANKFLIGLVALLSALTAL